MDRSQFEKEQKHSFRIGVAILAGGVILLLILNSLLHQWRPDGGGNGAYDSYRGPVLPMTGISGAEVLNVKRSVDFDFSPYADGGKEVILTDAYQLSNPTGETVTAELAYPFQVALIDEERFFPVITAEGSPVEATLHLSQDPGSRLSQAKDWDAYKAAMAEHDYLSNALAQYPDLHTPVTVYKIYDVQDESRSDVQNKYLTLTYKPDPGSTIWTYNCSDNELEDGTHYITLDVPEAAWQWGFCLLIVSGGTLRDFSQQGHHSTFPPRESNRLDGISAEIEACETTFSQILRELAEHYHTAPQYDSRFEKNPHASAELLYQGALTQIGNPDPQDAATVHQSIDGLFYSVLAREVLMYRVFSLTLSPGETVTVEASYHQSASRDHGGLSDAAHGYDMATTLGSSLTLNNQSASLSGGTHISITEQNFGFDLDAGIDTVTLDPEVARYYLKVRSSH